MKLAKQNGLVSNMPAKSLDFEQYINITGIIDVGIIVVLIKNQVKVEQEETDLFFEISLHRIFIAKKEAIL